MNNKEKVSNNYNKLYISTLEIKIQIINLNDGITSEFSSLDVLFSYKQKKFHIGLLIILFEQLI